MQSNRGLAIAAIVLGVVLMIVAVIYWAEPAKSLPFPDFLGHQAGSDTHHFKHGIAAFLLGIGCFVYAWFQLGPKRSTAQTPAR